MGMIYDLLKKATTFEDELLLEEALVEIFGSDWKKKVEQAILIYHLEEGEGGNWGGTVDIDDILNYAFGNHEEEVREAYKDGFLVEFEYTLEVGRTNGEAVIFVKHLKPLMWSPLTEEEVIEEQEKEFWEEVEIERQRGN